MASIIPTLNEDCIAIIISFIDRPSLLNLACTSKAGKVVALPAFFHTVTLQTSDPGKVMQFCNSVQRNSLAHHISRLNIICDTYIRPFGPELRDAMTRLVDVMASADSLAHFTIIAGADKLFLEIPAMLNTLLVHPPSLSLILMDIRGLDWLENHRFVGLRNLSFGFFGNSSDDAMDLLYITAGSATTLESMYLDVDRTLASLNFTEGCIPYSSLRMLSIAGAYLRFTGFCAAFPNVQFIRCDSAVISTDGPALLGPATNESHTLSELIGLEGNIESMALVGPRHKLRVAVIPYQIDTLSSLSRLTTAIAGDLLCSLSLFVQLRDPREEKWEDGTSGLSAEHFFAQICRIAPRLRFLSVQMRIVLKLVGGGRVGNYSACQEKAMEKISAIASPHLAGLEDLQCFHIRFAPRSPLARKSGVWAGFAKHCLSSLPRIRFLVLDLAEDRICLNRPEASATHADGVADFVEVKLDDEDTDRLLDRYQFEGPDWRLDGVADWLRSVRSLDTE